VSPWYSIKAAVQGTDTADISIFREIGGEGVRAREFLAQLAEIAAPKLRLFINSPGGVVVDALAIFNGMRATGKHIEVHILGIAASAASYIAMVGDKIVMPANTMMFLHNPINSVQGNAEEMREMADTLDKFGDMLFNEYAKRFKGSEDKLRELLASETWLSAAECLGYGLCDEVIDDIDTTAEFDIEQLPENVRTVFKAKPLPTPLEPLADAVYALAQDAGLEAFGAVFATDPKVTSLETAALAINEARNIQALAKLAGIPDHGGVLIRERRTVAQARIALCKALADADPHIDTAPRSQAASTDAEWSPTSLWADIRVMKAGGSR
jgi:ATP-dependent protease ClpP protease subunit